MDAGTGLVHTAPGPRRGGLRGRAAGSGCAIYNPVDDDGRFIGRGRALGRADGLGRQPADHRAPARARARWSAEVPLDAHLSALLALQEPDALPRHRAVVHRARPRGAPARARRCDAIRHERALDPALGRGAHLQHDRAPAGLVHLAPARLGRARSSPSTATGCGTLLLERARWSSTSPPSCAAGRAPTSGTRATAAELLPAGHPLPEVRRRRLPQGDRHPRRVVRLGLSATPRCSRPAPTCAGRPTCTWRARTSTAAGSTPRCSRRVGTRERRAVPQRPHPRVHGGRRGAEDVEVAAATRSRRRTS